MAADRRSGARGEKETPVVFYKELPRRGGAAADGPISGQFEGAAAEATQSGTYLLAKTSYVFNAAQVEGDTPPERPELPGLAVRLESAERFVAATGAVIVHGGDRAYYRPSEVRIQLPLGMGGGAAPWRGLQSRRPGDCTGRGSSDESGYCARRRTSSCPTKKPGSAWLLDAYAHLIEVKNGNETSR